MAQPPVRGWDQAVRVLVVSEDPGFFEEVRAVTRAEGAQTIACLGPAASPCSLDDKGLCPLAATSNVVVVDAPPSGAFRYHLTDIPAGQYAERVQCAHRETHVLLIAGAGPVGPTAEVMVTNDRDEGLHLLTWALRAIAITQQRRTVELESTRK